MLGIIGGMGPMASAVFYDMISSKTDASCDQENLDLILLSHAGMPDRTRAILSKDEAQIEEVRTKLLADAMFLQNAGCTAIAVTCNTAHYFVNMIEDELDIPFIHLIRETAEAMASEFGAKKVAVLATDGTIETRLYQDELSKRGVIAFTPKAEVQALVMHEIYECIKSGKPADEEIWKKIEEYVKAEGCEAAVLACTELSVVRKELSLGSFYFDPMDIMAERCLDFYEKRGEIKKRG
ncbi:MAG: aspartate/glutamate racemase family protein [[Eubacterium] sulci]|nr:aspartate/glutamate racemase family protein [[Eubacterium] sulci]MBF1183467.1 aspartate/glutamate racemase family protein [[Eubacterium] sulci]